MTSEQLKTFLIIVETKSFSRTAETLFITQFIRQQKDSCVRKGGRSNTI